MDFLTITFLAFLISFIIVLIGFKVINNDNNEFKRLFAHRNIKFIPMGNLFVDTIKKTRLELKRHHAIIKHGHVFGFVMMNAPTIVIADPELIELVLSKYFTNFINRRHLPLNDYVFSEFLFSIEDEQWKRVRSTLTPTFATGKLRLMKNILDETVETMLNNVNDSLESNNNVLNLKDIFGAFTMNSIVQIAFGVRIDSLKDKNNPVLINANQLFQNFGLTKSLKATIIYLFPFLSQLFNLQLFSSQFEFFGRLSEEIIEKKRNSFKNNSNQKPTNYIEFILEAEAEAAKLSQDNNNNSTSKPVKFLKNKEILAQSIMFFVAGFETVQTVLTHIIYKLAMHQDIQEKLYDEIREILQENFTDQNPYNLFTYDVVYKMKYLEAVIKEAMRLHTPATNTERVASEDIILKSSKHEIHVKKGDVVLIPIYSVHRDPGNFAEPEIFDPNRFLDDTNFHKYAYIPFGAGPRDCIARTLAHFEIKLAILHFIRCYRAEFCEKTPVPIQYNIQILGSGLINKEVYMKIIKR